MRTLAKPAFVLLILGAVFTLGSLGAIVVSEADDREEMGLPALTPFSPEVERKLHQIRDDTAELRGIEVLRLKDEGMLSQDQLREYYAAETAKLTDDDRRDVEVASKVYVLLHLLRPDTSYLDTAVEFMTEDVAGFYVFNEKKMVLVADEGDIDLIDEYYLSHEYTHSLQQKWVDDKRIDKLVEDESSEYSTTYSCVKEGDASVSAINYMQKTYGDDWYDMMIDNRPDSTEEETTGDEERAATPAIDRYNSFNYDECVTFVYAVYDYFGNEGVDKLYDRLPETTEQILHYDKWDLKEKPLPVSTKDYSKQLGAGWESVAQGAYGEFDLYNYLYSLLGDELKVEAVAKKAAAGWGGGQMRTYANKDEVAVHIALKMDTEKDLAEFRDAFSSGLAKQGFGIKIPNPNEWSWQNESEYGYLRWTRDENRVDIFVSTSATTRALGQSALTASR